MKYQSSGEYFVELGFICLDGYYNTNQKAKAFNNKYFDTEKDAENYANIFRKCLSINERLIVQRRNY